MERIECPNCKRKIRSINAYHYCKEVSVDELFFKKSDEILLAFDRILQQVVDWKDVEISATKNCIVFVRNKTFLVIKPMNKWLEVKFYSHEIIEDEYLHKSTPWNRKFEGVFRFENEHQIQLRFIDYFKNSYSIS
jgi:hypothetical protein